MIAKLTSTTGRLLIAAFCIAATEAVIWRDQSDISLKASQAEKFDVKGLPLQLGRWSGRPEELSPKVFEVAGASSMEQRTYTNEMGLKVFVFLASYRTLGGAPHSPTSCYPNGGWTILKEESQRDARDRPYRMLFVEQAGTRVAVAYWYQLGSTVYFKPDENRKLVQKLHWERKRWPPVVKAFIQVPIESSESHVKTTVDELGAQIYDWVTNNS